MSFNTCKVHLQGDLPAVVCLRDARAKPDIAISSVAAAAGVLDCPAEIERQPIGVIRAIVVAETIVQADGVVEVSHMTCAQCMYQKLLRGTGA